MKLGGLFSDEEGKNLLAVRELNTSKPTEDSQGRIAINVSWMKPIFNCSRLDQYVIEYQISEDGHQHNTHNTVGTGQRPLILFGLKFPQPSLLYPLTTKNAKVPET